MFAWLWDLYSFDARFRMDGLSMEIGHGVQAIICRAAQDKYGQCKCSEDAVMAIMKDAIQHCLNKEVS